MAAKKKSNDIRIVRVYDAPVKTVWDAWTDPEKVKLWWGPRGFTLTHHSKELKAGGHWSYTMHGPDGTDYPNTTKYLEVEKYQRLVYDHGGHEDRPPLFRVTVLFEEVKGKTRMDMSMTLKTPEEAEQMEGFIRKANGYSTWDRLAEFLTKESTAKEQFVINRSFDAPIDLMYELWTNPKHFSKWLAPTGMEMQFIRAELKPGGTSFYAMSGNGMKMHGRVHYLEMKKPNRLHYTQEFVDENEKPSHHPLAPTWPKIMKTTVLLSEEGPDRTRVTVTWDLADDVTAQELETFRQGKPGMMGGWGGSFDKLEALIDTMRQSG